MYNEDDFYESPDEFERQIGEFKQALMGSVKDEYKSEMESLRTENAELQKIKKNWESIKNEYRNKQVELASEKQIYKSQLRRVKLRELMVDFKIIMYCADSYYVDNPKCDKCNEKREIPYTLPSGRPSLEKCSCATRTMKYKPAQHEIYEFNLNGNDNRIHMHYQESDNENQVYNRTQYGETAYKQGMEYSAINKQETFFENESDCQLYCDWLNNGKDVAS